MTVQRTNKSNTIHTMSDDTTDSSEKLFYTIGEVAKMFKVNASRIRYWESQFDIIKPHRNKKGNRMFTQKDIENFHIIYHLVTERGMTHEGVRKKLLENRDDTLNNIEIVRRLEHIKSILLEMNRNLTTSKNGNKA